MTAGLKRYRSVPLDEVEDGAQLYEQVADRQGNVLLPAGAELNAALIRSLERRGIETVIVLDDSISAEALAQAREQAGARLDDLFSRSSGRANATLRQLVLDYRLEQLS
jgi:hypothetical protein